MEMNRFQVTPEKIQGRTVEEIVVTDMAVVMKFTDGTFLDIYLDQQGALKTSMNKIEE
ncbi:MULTISPECIES: hypothetical protein [Bacillaceae]|uniref:hypothetical protein n=1 Tax=Bacillaceae TaxID=186817 RepID=UPI000B06C60A|nr:hypothetical protein [Bacillus sp. FJAT-27916]